MKAGVCIKPTWICRKSQRKRNILKKRHKNPNCLFIKRNYTIKNSKESLGLATQDANIKRATAVIAWELAYKKKKGGGGEEVVESLLPARSFYSHSHTISASVQE